MGFIEEEKQQKQPRFLDQVFDILSMIPHLRKIFKAMWVFSTSWLGYGLLMEAISVLTGQTEFRSEWAKNFVMWIGVNPFFAYTLYLWNKREMITRVPSETK